MHAIFWKFTFRFIWSVVCVLGSHQSTIISSYHSDRDFINSLMPSAIILGTIGVDSQRDSGWWRLYVACNFYQLVVLLNSY